MRTPLKLAPVLVPASEQFAGAITQIERQSFAPAQAWPLREVRAYLSLAGDASYEAAGVPIAHQALVSMRGPRQWMLLARYTWEQMHGPIPKGMRVVHRDGNTLHDAPENYALLTPGEVIKLYHELDPEMSRENRQGRKRREATAEHNRLRAQIRRAVEFLPTKWYALDERRGVLYESPFRSRVRLAIALGLLPDAPLKNGKISRRTLERWPVALIRGSELGPAHRHCDRRPLPGVICRVCGCHQFDACHDDERGPCWWVEANLCSHCAEPRSK